jgi:hypothetical protein
MLTACPADSIMARDLDTGFEMEYDCSHIVPSHHGPGLSNSASFQNGIADSSISRAVESKIINTLQKEG